MIIVKVIILPSDSAQTLLPNTQVGASMSLVSTSLDTLLQSKSKIVHDDVCNVELQTDVRARAVGAVPVKKQRRCMSEHPRARIQIG